MIRKLTFIARIFFAIGVLLLIVAALLVMPFWHALPTAVAACLLAGIVVRSLLLMRTDDTVQREIRADLMASASGFFVVGIALALQLQQGRTTLAEALMLGIAGFFGYRIFQLTRHLREGTVPDANRSNALQDSQRLIKQTIKALEKRKEK